MGRRSCLNLADSESAFSCSDGYVVESSLQPLKADRQGGSAGSKGGKGADLGSWQLVRRRARPCAAVPSLMRVAACRAADGHSGELELCVGGFAGADFVWHNLTADFTVRCCRPLPKLATLLVSFLRMCLADWTLSDR